MRAAGAIVARVLAALVSHARPGTPTSELDRLARELTRESQAVPAFLGYPGGARGEPYPACVCVSINEQVVHGIPGERRLVEGDIVSLDYGCFYQGYCGDAALTVGIGTIREDLVRLLEVTRGALMAGIAAARPGGWLWDVIEAIQGHVEGQGFQVVREYQGHGIGRRMHEPPSVPNFMSEPRPPNVRLRPGLTLALEPMVTAGDWRTRVLEDGWTVVTRDGRPAAHFEHTIAVTEGGVEILTAGR